MCRLVSIIVVIMVAFSAYPLEGLFDLACREGVDIRPTLLRVLTDLYVQKPTHTEMEEAQYIELASRLVESVDAPTRAVVAGRLATYAAAPAPVLERLAALTEIPAPPLAPVLPNPDNIERAGPNPAARQRERELAESFFAASAEERRYILINLDAFSPIAGRQTLRVAADVIRDIENAALARNTAALARALARTLRISGELAERVISDPSGEPIVVVAKALGMQAAVLQRILLFINAHVGQSVARVFSLASLFEEITPAAAEDMIALWRKASAQRRPYHEPALWDGERAKPRQATMHAPRATESHNREQPASRLRNGGY